MTSRTKLIAGMVAGFGAASIIGVASVTAATNTGSDSLASKIATTFHINQGDVQKVIDQDRTDHEAKRATDEKARLDAAVKAGTITSAQETLIINKQTELKAARDAKRDNAADEVTRKATMKTEMDALKQWATDNKIPMDLLRPAGGHGHGGPNGGVPPTN